VDKEISRVVDTIRIVLADDHALVRQGTRRMLEEHAELRVVGEAGDGVEALDMVERLKPDVLILDVRMPKLSGVEVVRRLQGRSVPTRVLVLSAYDDDEYIVALMKAGASGYLLKTAPVEELVEAIRSIHQGESVLHPAIAAKVARLWGQYSQKVGRELDKELSDRELEVLSLAARGLRNKDIASRLNISVRTVEGHVNAILARLGVESRVEAILYAVSRGWVSAGQARR
jgi:DNA-binding NarL/FixJ family response regulator